jgi:hypothetical protein
MGRRRVGKGKGKGGERGREDEPIWFPWSGVGRKADECQHLMYVCHFSRPFENFRSSLFSSVPPVFASG